MATLSSLESNFKASTRLEAINLAQHQGSGVARVLGARGQSALMAPSPRPKIIHTLRLAQSEYWGGGGGPPRVWPNPNTGEGGGGGGGGPLEFGQIRLLPLAFGN